MDRVEKTIFLSYRRTNAPWALAIFQNLTQHGFDVFFDYSGVASGDFEQVILGNILAREQKAEASERPAVREEELTAQQWFERGFAAVDFDEQVRFYSEAIRLRPDYAAAFYNRGIARAEKGDLEGTIADFNEAIRLKPDYAAAFYSRVNARRRKVIWKGRRRTRVRRPGLGLNRIREASGDFGSRDERL